MTARDDAQAAHERLYAEVLEIDADTCTRTYGVAPCTAAAGTGNECYNTFGTCQDQANYARTTRTIKFCSRHMAAPAGETLRPYITTVSATPTEIVPDKGLAMRGQTTVTLIDEPASDVGEDPYVATRPAEATGTFWGRLLARNYNLAGRPARIRRGYVVSPFDWATFQTELYMVSDVSGIDRSGKVKITLADPVKKLDAVKIPVVTDGKLAAALAGISHTGVAQAAASTTITLATTASAVDDAYNGQEVYVFSGTGSGQRRVISDYVGATRVATITVAWSVNPTSTSSYEVTPLSLTLNTGKGAQYADPATSGKNEYVLIGDEVIRYTAKSGDVLSWTDGTYRGQFGTTRADASTNANVQLCRAWIGKAIDDVVEDIINEGGLADSYIDLTQLGDEVTTWYSGQTITACMIAPESASALLADLLIDLNASVWWDAVSQKVKFRANMPQFADPVALSDDDFIINSLDVKPQNADRITQAAIYYDIRSAVLDTKKPVSYGRAALYVDTDAESANEYGDQRPWVRLSRWLSSGNDTFASALVSRTLLRRRDAPVRFTFKLDPRSFVDIGDLVEITTDQLQGPSGAAQTVTARITSVKDMGTHQEVIAVQFKQAFRRGFIAPAGQPNYTSASDAEKEYAYIATTGTQKMSNGDPPYQII